MPARKKGTGRSVAPSGSSAEVNAFMSSLEHPCKPEIEARHVRPPSSETWMPPEMTCDPPGGFHFDSTIA